MVKVGGFNSSNKAMQVSCGDAFTLVLTEKHQVFSFGKVSHGRLGLGSSSKIAIHSNLQDTSQSEASDYVYEP